MPIHRSPDPYFVVGAYRVQDIFHGLLPMLRLSPMHTRHRCRVWEVGGVELDIVGAEVQPPPYLNQSVVLACGRDELSIV
jgi:hypothetical protein